VASWAEHPGSVSNGSGKPACGPGLDRNNRSVRVQTSLKTRPTDSWRAKPGPVPVNPRVSQGLARPFGSKLQFRISGFTFIVAYRYGTVGRKIVRLVCYSPHLMYWVPS